MGKLFVAIYLIFIWYFEYHQKKKNKIIKRENLFIFDGFALIFFFSKESEDFSEREKKKDLL